MKCIDQTLIRTHWGGFVALQSAFDRPHFLISCRQYSDAPETSSRSFWKAFTVGATEGEILRGKGGFTETLSHSGPPTHMQHAHALTHTHTRRHSQG